MTNINQSGFDKMDQLSEQKVPFIFIIDFLMEKVEVFDENEFTKKGLLFDFPNVRSLNSKLAINKKLLWKSYPETLDSYKKGFDIVQDNLKKGNSYLINYTRKTPVETNFSLEEIFNQTKAKYKFYYPEKFVFFSPETFVQIIENKIVTHPMKGTINANQIDAKEKLLSNKKEKAEHYTVVDLLRNDLSMVADNVKVDDFQRIDLIKTYQSDLLAMSSEISGFVKEDYQNKIGSIMKTLLPAGSILGAPKQKTLEIILQAEQYDRGYYSGVCGYFDGQDLDSCVMIRFLEKHNNQLFFKSGGGITHQSQLLDEYEEMKNKIYVPIY